jgi:hypothetical protein
VLPGWPQAPVMLLLLLLPLLLAAAAGAHSLNCM